MSIQSNFPNLQPSLLLDFANTKQLDNRVTFTRSTPATYYDGKTTAMAEQNLLLDSQTFTSWTKVSLTATNNATTAPDGTATATLLTLNSANAEHYVSCITPLTDTVIYTYSVYAKPNGSNWIVLNSNNTTAATFVYFNVSTGTVGTTGAGITASIVNAGNGWYRCIYTIKHITASHGTNGVQLYIGNSTGTSTVFTGDGTSGVYIWGAQLEQRNAVTAYTPTTTQAITNYIPVLLSAGGNQPRFDCNPTTGESLGLLIEEGRTNIATYSSVNTSGWVSVSSTLTNNYATSPDGTTSAGYLADDTNNVQHSLYQTVTLANATSYSFSAYIKSYGRNYAEIIPFGTPTGNTVVGASFNLSNGTVSATTGAVTATITSVANGWYRCSVIYTTVASGAANFNIFPSNGSNIGDRVYTGNGFSGLLVWGAQVEAGAFPTSYIATTSASATRTADVAQISGTNLTSWYSQGNGTFYAEASTASVAGDVMILEGTNSTNAFLDVSMTFATTSTQFINRFTSLNSDIRKSGAVSANTMVKFSGSITSSLGTTVGATNGTTAPAVGGFTANFGADRMFIGSRGGSSLFLNAPIRKLAFYPAQLTQTQQNSITG